MPLQPPSRRKSWPDRGFRWLTAALAFFVFALLIGIVLSLIDGSWATISEYGFSFLWSGEWDPVHHRYGALSTLLGTLISSFLALLIAVPVSFGIALVLTQLAPRAVRRPLGMAIEMLAAIPSIIYGMWGLFVFVPLFQRTVQPFLIQLFAPVPVLGALFSGPPLGIGLFTAGLILSIMILPFITAIMRDVFEQVPAMLKESAYGLGSTTWEVGWKVILPYTRHGVIAGIMLGLGRALGETMAVTFVIGNAFQMPQSLFSASNSIASALANEFNEAGGLQKSALLELGLLLFLITTIVLILSRLMLWRLARKSGAVH